MSPFYDPSWRLILSRLLYMHAALVWLVGVSATLRVLFTPIERDCSGSALIAYQVETIKAARPIAAGTILTPEMVTKSFVPAKFLPPNPVYAADLEVYMGMPVSVNMQEGAMLLASDVNQRAATLAISAREGGRMGEAWSLVWYVTWR